MLPGEAKRICTYGDALIDVVVELGADPVPDDDVPATTTLVVGGQAANVAAWFVALGGTASVLSAVADDAGGRFVRESLAERGVRLPVSGHAARTGIIVSMVSADGTRTMMSDRGHGGDVTPADLDPDWFAGCAWLHLSGYTLFAGGWPDAPLRAAAMARGHDAQVSVDLSSAHLIGRWGADEARRRLTAAAPSLVFATDTEAAAIGATAAAVTVIKHGARGASVHSGAGVSEVAAATVARVRDSTGAGDAFAAGWLFGGPTTAAYAAGCCVQTVGAMPPESLRRLRCPG